MKLFFAHPKEIYDTDIEALAKDKIIKDFAIDGINNVLIDPNVDFKKLISDEKFKNQLDSSSLKGYKKERYIQNIIDTHSLNSCDAVVYMNTFTKVGIVNFTPGVRNEVDNSIISGKRIFRLYLDKNKNLDNDNKKDDERKNSSLMIKELSRDSILDYAKDIYRQYTPDKLGWALKSFQDYYKLYSDNDRLGEALEFMRWQCYDKRFEKIGVSGILSHYNNLFWTRDRSKIKLHRCYFKGHKNTGGDWRIHAYVNPYSQKFETVCPYFDSSSIFHPRLVFKVDKYPLDLEGMISLVVKNRVIHKLSFIFDESVWSEGTALRDKDGKAVINGGRVFIDKRKIKGFFPIIDLDIRDSAKKKGLNFFSKEVYKDYINSINILEGSKYWDDNYRLMFSGNGIYLEFAPIDFVNLGIDYDTHYDKWNIIKNELQNLLDKGGIQHIQIEKGYGWNRYFKLSGTFHATKERVAIPLHKDFKDWSIDEIDKMSSIKNYVDGVVRFGDVIEWSGWR